VNMSKITRPLSDLSEAELWRCVDHGLLSEYQAETEIERRQHTDYRPSAEEKRR